jgi:hypothetical protein
MDLGPVRVCPAGQLSVMKVPSNTGLVDPLTPIELQLLNGLSHVPINSELLFFLLVLK